jgi:hypothetical protein
VGSSSSSMSGRDSSRRHSATRRRSPPDSFVTSASQGGRRRASAAISRVRSGVVAAGGLQQVLQLRLLLGQRVEVGIGLGVGGVDLVEPRLRALDVAEGLLHVAAHVLGRVELRLLLQVADANAGLRPRLALDLGIDARHDPEQGGLAGAVQAEHADLGAREKGQGDVAQDVPLGRHDLRDAVHRVDVLRHGLGFGGWGLGRGIMRHRGRAVEVPGGGAAAGTCGAAPAGGRVKRPGAGLCWSHRRSGGVPGCS